MRRRGDGKRVDRRTELTETRVESRRRVSMGDWHTGRQSEKRKVSTVMVTVTVTVTMTVTVTVTMMEQSVGG